MQNQKHKKIGRILAFSTIIMCLLFFYWGKNHGSNYAKTRITSLENEVIELKQRVARTEGELLKCRTEKGKEVLKDFLQDIVNNIE